MTWHSIRVPDMTKDASGGDGLTHHCHAARADQAQCITSEKFRKQNARFQKGGFRGAGWCEKWLFQRHRGPSLPMESRKKGRPHTHTLMQSLARVHLCLGSPLPQQKPFSSLFTLRSSRGAVTLPWPSLLRWGAVLASNHFPFNPPPNPAIQPRLSGSGT